MDSKGFEFHLISAEMHHCLFTQVKNMPEISSDPAYMDNFDKFAIKLISALETTFCPQSNARSSSVAREKPVVFQLCTSFGDEVAQHGSFFQLAVCARSFLEVSPAKIFSFKLQ